MPEWFGYFSFVLKGMANTSLIVGAAIPLAMLASLVVGIGAGSRSALVRLIMVFYTEIFRGTSAVVQLVWCYYALPVIGIRLSPIATAIIVLGLNGGAYGSEIVRGALGAVPKDQIEAALALNYGKWQQLRHVVLPQALRYAIPPLGNLSIDILKASALASLVTVGDLTFYTQLFRNFTGSTLIPFLSAFVAYFAMASLIAVIFRKIEKGLPG